MNLLSVIIKLLRTEAVDERVKLCFILGENQHSFGITTSANVSSIPCIGRREIAKGRS
jgi:hypothetical protein